MPIDTEWVVVEEKGEEKGEEGVEAGVDALSLGGECGGGGDDDDEAGEEMQVSRDEMDDALQTGIRSVHCSFMCIVH